MILDVIKEVIATKVNRDGAEESARVSDAAQAMYGLKAEDSALLAKEFTTPRIAADQIRFY